MTLLQASPNALAVDIIKTTRKQGLDQQHLQTVLSRVADVVAPVWPLKDYVALNPYAGVSDRPFMNAREFLKIFSDCEMLMPLEYYVQQWQQGDFGRDEIEAAIEDLMPIGGSWEVSSEEVVLQLEAATSKNAQLGQSSNQLNESRNILSIAEQTHSLSSINWTEAIRHEIAKYAAAHYDEGQSVWGSPWQDLPLYQAWCSAAIHDCNVEVLGLKGFRKFVSLLPKSPQAAIAQMLKQLNVPPSLWERFLLCQAFTIPGWCAWAKYQDECDDNRYDQELIGLLAIRLAYDVALAELFEIASEPEPAAEQKASSSSKATATPDHATVRYVLLRASEIGFRNQLLSSLSAEPSAHERSTQASRKLVQMVFCIDVRSERIRRKLEELSEKIETLGFAGFFGMPVEFVPLGEVRGNAHVPVLLKPQFKLHEGLNSPESAKVEATVISRRSHVRAWRKLWKSFQTSAIGCFSFVETTGLLYGFKLLGRAAGWNAAIPESRYDKITKSHQENCGPTLRDLNHQGVTTSQQADLAQGMLKNLGLQQDFARLVVFCGHASQTENNPLAAGLDCGACGGHSGEPNARFAALLLNQPYIRQALARRGVDIPEDTHFLAGLHNTTTDELEYFDLNRVPQTHREDLEELLDCSKTASLKTREERLPIVDSKSLSDLARRSRDWSEVRPEWGLAGNAAFIVAPRSLTKHVNLNGRSFLHSYDHTNDPHGEVLETIMTAPMVVAHLINMQYYASTVDNQHFGSGNKTVHNVVGKFGVLSGNSGDLMTGLPWQSLHTGKNYQHLPLRLQAVIAAPRKSIERVIDKHEGVAKLLTNSWLHLIAIDEGQMYRYAENGTWQAA